MDKSQVALTDNTLFPHQLKCVAYKVRLSEHLIVDLEDA